MCIRDRQIEVVLLQGGGEVVLVLLIAQEVEVVRFGRGERRLNGVEPGIVDRPDGQPLALIGVIGRGHLFIFG